MFTVNDKDYKLVKESKLVNSKWYKAIYKDVDAIGMDPIEHYLKYGWLMLRNPCKRFDTKYYIENNQDISLARENPLLHYIKFGMKEGRKIHPHSITDKEKEITERLVAHLWGGHSNSAMKELQKIYLSENFSVRERTFAAWHAARWCFFINEYQEALQLAELVRQIDEKASREKRFVMLFSFCYLMMDDTINAEEELNAFLLKRPSDSDAVLALSNIYNSNDEEKLKLINMVYENNGFSGIRKIDDFSSLSIHNVIGLDKDVSFYDNRKVSVIMPIYNAEENIDTALRGLLNQTWKNIEIIAVDDVSTDKTFEKLLAWSELDKRVIPIKQKKNGGAYLARNAGLKIATGEYITTHDSDDWSHPQKIETQISHLDKNEKLKGVITYWVRTLEDMTFTQNWRLNSELVHWSHSSFLFKKEVIDEIGGWDNVQVGGDTEFIWRVERKYGTYSVKKINKTVPFSFALDDEGSLTRTKATHVKTIHFGLRHIYRQICQSWHKNTKSLKINQGHLRAFTAPLRMINRAPEPIHLKVLYISDFSKNKSNKKIINDASALEVSDLKGVGLFHWPDFDKKVEDLRPEYFALLERGAQPICSGEVVEVQEVKVIDMKAINRFLDAYPLFKTKNIKISCIDDNENLNDQVLLNKLMNEILN